MKTNLYQTKWEKRSAVRKLARIIFNPEETGYLFPLTHQPLCAHPTVQQLNKKDFDYIVTQSLYRYCNDISVIETEIVNKSAFGIIKDAYPVKFDNEFKISAFTIMLDEVYHAYVAFDAMNQTQLHTGISPLPMPKLIEIQKAINLIKPKLEDQYYKSFELITVCIAENTLTKEMINMIDKKETHPFFQKIITDHLADESRHCGYFLKVLKYFWSNLNDDYKKSIGKELANFVELYLGTQIEAEHNKTMLLAVGMSDEEASRIIEDVHFITQLSPQHPMLKNIIFQIGKAGLLDKFVINAFKEKQWV